MNLRAALAMALDREEGGEPPVSDEAQSHLEGVARAHRYGDMLRAAYGG